jgi:hypothetical protein
MSFQHTRHCTLTPYPRTTMTIKIMMGMFPSLLLPPQQLQRHEFLSHTSMLSETTRGSVSFGILSPIQNYILDCGGVLVYT